MRTITLNNDKYKVLLKNQEFILKELDRLRTQVKILGSLERFENLAKKGRVFAKTKKIKMADILKDD